MGCPARGLTAAGRVPSVAEGGLVKTLRSWVISIMLGALLLALAASIHAKTDDQAAIRKLENDLAAAMGSKDIDRIMSSSVPDEPLFVFDCTPPRQYVGAKAYRK